MDEMDHVQAINEQWTEGCLAQHKRRPTRQRAVKPGPIECEDCGTEIPAARLAAQPDATRCIECQRYFEIRRPH